MVRPGLKSARPKPGRSKAITRTPSQPAAATAAPPLQSGAGGAVEEEEGLPLRVAEPGAAELPPVPQAKRTTGSLGSHVASLVDGDGPRPGEGDALLREHRALDLLPAGDGGP